MTGSFVMTMNLGRSIKRGHLALIAIVIMIPSWSGAEVNSRNSSNSSLRRQIKFPSDVTSGKFPRTVLFPRFLHNGSFEIPGGNDKPDGWEVFRVAFTDSDIALARSGTTSVRSSFLYGYYQQLETTVSPFETFAISGFANREFGYEKPGIRTVTYDSSFAFLKELNEFSPMDAMEGTYGPFWVGQTMPSGSHYIQVFLRGEMANSWIRYDDLSLYTEQLTTATATEVGEPWVLQGGATRVGESFALPSGGAMLQEVAAGKATQSYFVTAQYQADFPTTITVSERWLPRSFSESEITTTTNHHVTGSGQLLSDPGRPEGESSGKSQVSIIADSSTVSLTRIKRGFAMVEPRIFTGGEASVDTPLRFTAAWPDYLSTASVEVLSGTQVLDSISPELHGTAFQVGWPDSLEADAGTYTARFHLQSVDGDSVSVDRTFTILQDGATSAPVAPAEYDEFLRSTWIFVNGQSEARMQEALQLAKSDGFNAAVICCESNQLVSVRQIAESLDLKFIIFVPDVHRKAADYVRGLPFTKAGFLPYLHSILDVVTSSPQYLGVYLTDGMTTPDGFNVTRQMLHSVIQDGTMGQPWFLPDSNLSQANLDVIQPPTVLIGIYPYIPTNPDPAKALISELPSALANVQRSAAAGRSLWYIVQAFSDGSSKLYYSLPPEYHYAQQAAAVMIGAKGISSFLFSSGFGQTQRDSNLQPTSILPGYQEFNSVMDRIGPHILQLGVPELLSNVPAPFAVSAASTEAGEKFVHVLNADGSATHTLLLSGDSIPSGAMQDIVGERNLPRGSGDEIIVQLKPGGWALFSIGSNGLITSTTLELEPPEETGSLALDVLNEFSPVRDSGGSQPANGVQFSDDGETLAVNVGAFSYEQTKPQFYRLLNNGIVERVNGLLEYPSEDFRAAGELYRRSSPMYGVDFYLPSANLNTPYASYSGYSGGAEDALVAGENTWISLGNMGMRRVASGTGKLTSVETAPTGGFGAYTQLFGPFDDGSVTAVVDESVLRNFKIGSMSNITRTELRGVDSGGAMNDSRKIAAPRHSFGVGLVQATPTGEMTVVGNIKDDMWDVTATAWVTEQILAVADALRGVYFYKVKPDNSFERLGWWQIPGSLPAYITGLDAAEGKLAVSTYQSKVYVLDSSQLGVYTAAREDWQLFE